MGLSWFDGVSWDISIPVRFGKFGIVREWGIHIIEFIDEKTI